MTSVCCSSSQHTSETLHLPQLHLRWPRELNALQLQKTHANKKSTSKSRKHFHHFDSRWCKCSQHKQINKHTANPHNTTKYILFAAHFFFGCVVSICSVCVVKLTKVVLLICRRFFLFAARFFFWLCCEHLKHVRCKIEKVVSLICRCFFYLQRVELSRPPYPPV